MRTIHRLKLWLLETMTTQAELAARAKTQQARIARFLTGADCFGPRLAQRVVDATRAISLEKGHQGVQVELVDLVVHWPGARAHARAKAKARRERAARKQT